MHAEWNKWAWDLLQIAPTQDARAVKRAYATRLKSTRPDEDADAFQKLRQAYDHALALAQAALEDDVAEQVPSTSATEPSSQAEPATASTMPSPGIDIVAPAAPAADNPAPAPISAQTMVFEFEASSTPTQSWDEFLRGYHNAPNTSLHYSLANEITKHTRGRDFDNLDFANAFEVEAARYCARPDADPVLIEGLNAFYRWEADPSLLNAAQPGLAWQIMSELRALRMHHHLLSRKTDASRALLASTPPRWSRKLYNRSVTDEIQQLIQHMRWNCPETLQRKLNPEVVSWWEEKLARKRLQGHNLLASFVLGASFSTMLFSSLHYSDVDHQIKEALGHNGYYVSIWLLGQLLLLAATCALVFGPSPLSGRLQSLLQSRAGQLGWIAPTALLSLPFMTLPPHASAWLLLPLCLGISAVALYVMVVSTLQLSGVGRGVGTGVGTLKLLGIFIGMLLVHSRDNDVFGPMFLPWAYMLVLGGEHYYQLLDAGFKHLTKLRAAWLVSSVLTVIGVLNHGYDAPTSLIVISWALAVTGMLISTIYANSTTLPYLCVFIYFTASKFAAVFAKTEIGEMLIPTTMLLTTMVFTVANLLTRTVSRRPFS